jgi:transcriptional regulator with XRE-family HTH domain
MSEMDRIETEFCVRLRKIRRAQNLTLRELEAKSGVGINTISRHERHIGRPYLGTCERLAEALGYPLPHFLTADLCFTCGGKPPAGYVCTSCDSIGEAAAEVAATDRGPS